MPAELRIVGDKVSWKETAGFVYELEGVDEGASSASNGSLRLYFGDFWYVVAGRDRRIAGSAETENTSANIINGSVAVNGNRLIWKEGDTLYSVLAEGAGREWSDFATVSESESISDETVVTEDTVSDEDAVFTDDGWVLDANAHPNQPWSDATTASESESISDESALSDDTVSDTDTASTSDAWSAEKAAHPNQPWSDSASASEGESVSDESALSDDTVSDTDTASASDAWNVVKAAHPNQPWSDATTASESESISDESAVENDTVSDGDSATASDSWSVDKIPVVNPTIAYSNANDLGFGLAQGEVRAGDDCESVRVEYTINGGTLTYLETINTTPNSATTHQTDSVSAFASDEVCFFFTPFSEDAEGGVSGGAAMACVTLS